MKLSSVSWLCAAACAVAGAVFACGNNSPTTSSPGPSNGGSSSSGGGGSSSGSGSGSSSSGGGGVNDAGGIGDAGVCASTIVDKMTPCTTEPTCVKGCGPYMAGGVNNNLGYKPCSCGSAGTYQCAGCNYPPPLPSCYAPAASPPACAADVVNKGACATPCSGVCTMVSDAGKLQGCVCVTTSAGATQWTCATTWW